MSLSNKLNNIESELQDLFHEVENLDVSRETKEEIRNNIDDALIALQNAVNIDFNE